MVLKLTEWLMELFSDWWFSGQSCSAEGRLMCSLKKALVISAFSCVSSAVHQTALPKLLFIRVHLCPSVVSVDSVMLTAPTRHALSGIEVARHLQPVPHLRRPAPRGAVQNRPH